MKKEELKELLEKFYAGQTSTDEEEKLKKCFSGTDIIPGFEAEKEVFNHYAGSENIPVPSVDFEARILKGIDDFENKQRTISLKKRYITIISAAATILLLVGSYFIFFNKEVEEDTFSDPHIAYAETMKILYEVSVKLNKGKEALRPLNKMKDAMKTGLESVDKSASVISTNIRKSRLFEGESPENNK